MESTCVTVDGFSKPTVAHSLIESVSAEIGLSQCFLWTFPQPTYSPYNTLEKVDKDFNKKLVSNVCTNACLYVFLQYTGTYLFINDISTDKQTNRKLGRLD